VREKSHFYNSVINNNNPQYIILHFVLLIFYIIMYTVLLLIELFFIINNNSSIHLHYLHRGMNKGKQKRMKEDKCGRRAIGMLKK
jgi:hypothetical protein